MKFFLTILLLSISLTALAQSTPKAEKLCVVISGAKKDHNGFVDEELFKSGQKIAGVDCKVFDSWQAAKTYAHGNLIKNGKLMVVQGAHGNNDGTYAINDGPISAENIYKNLKELSESFHVGSVIHSCYSASILNLKLIDDEASTSKLDQLCLVASSSFGRITYSNDNDMIQHLLKLKPGDNLEKPFINNPSGVISSAAWSEVGLPQYLMSEATHDGFKALQNMESILRGDPNCSPEAKAAAQICLSPLVTDETFEDVRAFIDPIVPTERKGYFERSLTREIKELESALAKDPESLAAKNGLTCKKEILNIFQTRFGEKLKELNTYPDVMNVRDEIKSMGFYRIACTQYLSSLDKDSKEHQSLVTKSFQTGIEDYMNSLKRLDEKYKSKKLGKEFDMHKFLTVAISDKKVCSLEDVKSKDRIIQSLFGMSFFADEMKTNYEGTESVPNEEESGVSTQVILKGFQNSALLKPKLSNVKDQERRKACQNFKF